MVTGAATLTVLNFTGWDGCFLKAAALLLCGASSAVIYLCWASIFGRMSPSNVIFCFSSAVLFGEALKFVFMGLEPAFIRGFTIFLPFASFVCAWIALRGARSTSAESTASCPVRGYPWKPILMIELCFLVAAFDAQQLRPLNIGNAMAAILVAVLMMAVLSPRSRLFQVRSINQVLYPLFIIAFVLFIPASPVSVEVASFRNEVAYTMSFMLVLVVLSGVSYHYGVSAIWLSGIERFCRFCAEACGWGLSMLFASLAGSGLESVVRMTFEGLLVVALVVLFFYESRFCPQVGLLSYSRRGSQGDRCFSRQQACC